MFGRLSLALALSLACAAGSTAGEADVVAVEVAKEAGGSYRFDVTVAHADEGWDHYADAFDVVGPDGHVLGTRVLLHPHETEQPFTRSLGGVAVPDGVTEVILRARDSVHGHGGAEVRVSLPAE
jgi:opacity protein-like surface antigen